MDHIPVLLTEVIRHLVNDPAGVYVDATVGDGGHAEGLLAAVSGKAQLIALDRDPEALQRAKKRLARWAPQTTFIHGNFSDMAAILHTRGVDKVHGILMDLGVSSLQLDKASRGFSFRREGPLDMRQDPGQDLTAADLVNRLPVPELARIFSDYGEERWAVKIAHTIGQEREKGAITNTTQLARIVSLAVPRRFHPRRIDPATRVFQALRIAVNAEIEGLGHALRQAPEILYPGGRIGVIAYESLSDRLVKQTFRRQSQACVCPPECPECRCGGQASMRRLTNKPIRPGAQETARNPRARSARLRIAERINVNRNQAPATRERGRS